MNWFKKTENIKPASHAFIFYFSALAVWSLYDLLTTGKTGFEQPIFLIGGIIFSWSKAAARRHSKE